MTLLEAAKQALKAMEWHVSQTRSIIITTEAMEALRQAIEQAEKQEPVAYWNGKDMFKRADEVQYVANWTDYYYYPLYGEPRPCQTCESLARTVMMDQTSHDTAPPQAEKQEPYCWVQSKLVQGTFYKEKPRRIHTIPLYSAPPQRKWVGLTDEEIELTDHFSHNRYKFARGIEAKLKEKNT